MEVIQTQKMLQIWQTLPGAPHLSEGDLASLKDQVTQQEAAIADIQKRVVLGGTRGGADDELIDAKVKMDELKYEEGLGHR